MCIYLLRTANPYHNLLTTYKYIKQIIDNSYKYKTNIILIAIKVILA